MSEYEPPYVHGEQGDRSAQVIQIETGKHIAAVAICAALCGLSAAIAVWSVMRFDELETRYRTEAEKTATEYRVMLNHTMELEASVKEIRNGK